MRILLAREVAWECIGRSGHRPCLEPQPIKRVPLLPSVLQQPPGLGLDYTVLQFRGDDRSLVPRQDMCSASHLPRHQVADIRGSTLHNQPRLWPPQFALRVVCRRSITSSHRE